MFYITAGVTAQEPWQIKGGARPPLPPGGHTSRSKSPGRIRAAHIHRGGMRHGLGGPSATHRILVQSNASLEHVSNCMAFFSGPLVLVTRCPPRCPSSPKGRHLGAISACANRGVMKTVLLVATMDLYFRQVPLAPADLRNSTSMHLLPDRATAHRSCRFDGDVAQEHTRVEDFKGLSSLRRPRARSRRSAHTN